MNDIFKFRVWNKHINEYCDIQNLFILPTGEIGYFITDGSYPHQRKFMHQEDMIIEMCTGLKDKNGNLIYDGDVVKQTQYDFDPDKRRVVTGIIKRHTGHAQFVFEYPDDTGGHNISEIGWGIIEIIGNVHEQAEQKDK